MLIKIHTANIQGRTHTEIIKKLWLLMWLKQETLAIPDISISLARSCHYLNKNAQSINISYQCSQYRKQTVCYISVSLERSS